ncbi:MULTISPECIES: hypothetical protein [unclassified Streptomyces]|uniref:hypothetical protein n=1 Tax=unclassified Streptomyces TaxID=2593676 RepID=UPI001BEBCA72|nr:MULTISPECIES: hypothetical protein [unclassified Streptomyces]MBT2405579.1 hypothetical protein [Streptomyces sp. ISL-21]MBT2607741.1 hypothetical protein [Streptomyces sp. ISL-87]
MEFMPSAISLALYALTGVCAVALMTIWVLTNRGRRNAGFAAKSQLKRQMSAKAILKATEIRPSLTRGEDHPARTPAVSLAKNRSAGS